MRSVTRVLVGRFLRGLSCQRLSNRPRPFFCDACGFHNAFTLGGAERHETILRLRDRFSSGPQAKSCERNTRELLAAIRVSHELDSRHLPRELGGGRAEKRQERLRIRARADKPLVRKQPREHERDAKSVTISATVAARERREISRGHVMAKHAE